MSEIRPTGPVPVMRPSNPLKPNVGSDRPPSDAVKSAPFNFGEGLLPHVVTFQGIVSTVSRIYRYYDEAMKHSFDNARFMRNDLMVMEPVEQRRRACALLNWHLEIDDEDDPKQKQLAEHLTKLIKAIPNFLKFKENLLDAVWYGKNANQWQWGWKKIHGVEPAHGHYGNQIIKSWKPLGGDKIVFRYDDGLREYDPNQVGIRVGAGYTAGDKGVQGRMLGGPGGTRKVEACDYGLAYFLEPWERKLLAIHKHMIEDGEYEDPQSAGKIHGVGVRSRIYWSWYMKQELHAWMMEFLERNAAGMEIWYYPTGNPEAEEKTRKAAEERIGNARNVILMPRPVDEAGNQYGVEIVPANMGGADTVERILTEYFGDQIMRYILGQTMTNKPQAGGFGSDLPQIQYGTYAQIIKYDAINLGETLTTDVVIPLLELNYPQCRDIPVRFVVDTESEDLEAKLSAWKSAYEVGLKTKAGDWYKLIGASKPEDEDEIIQNPVTKQQDRLYEQWQANKQSQVVDPMQPAVAQVQGGIGAPEPGAPGAEQPPELPPIAGGGGEEEEAPEGYERGGEPAKYDNPHGGTYDTGRGTIPASAIVQGTIHEMEHTKNVQVAREIAMDHLRERPDYYEVLERAMAQPPTIPIENSERERLAKYAKRAPAVGQGSMFDEEAHPRGEKGTEKGGQFVEKGGSGGGGETVKPLPGQRDIFGGVEPERKPEHKPKVVESPKQTQTALLHGLNDLPGQQDLFNADKGEEERAEENPPREKTDWGEATKMLPKGTTLPNGFTVGEPVKATGHGKLYSGFVAAFAGSKQPTADMVLVADENGGIVGSFYVRNVALDETAKKRAAHASMTDEEAKEAEKAKPAYTLPNPMGGDDIPCYPDNPEPEVKPGHKAVDSKIIIGKGKDKYCGFRMSIVENAEGKAYVQAERGHETRGSVDRIDVHFKKLDSDDIEKTRWLNEAAEKYWHEYKRGRATQEMFSRSFDPGLMHQQLLERYYKQSPPNMLDAWWAGGPGSIVVVQEGKPLRYSRSRRGNVTVESVLEARV